MSSPSLANSLPGASIIDLNFLGIRESVASCLLEGGGELVLVDCGPSTCLPALRAGLAERGLKTADLTAILLTHIHFDHAGAAGTLVRENPRLRVYVHEVGAKHLGDPSRLTKSATRLYGDAIQRMFGEFLPVPPENLHALAGGEVFPVAGRKIEVAYTPGHASHHVCFFDQSTGTAFTGDTAGVRLPGFDFVAPVTPPPDVNLDAYDASLTEIANRNPSRLFLTHFGSFENVQDHLQQSREGLKRWAERADAILKESSENSDRIARFNAFADEDFRRNLPEDVARRYAVNTMPTVSWHGLARYWRKRAEAQS